MILVIFPDWSMIRDFDSLDMGCSVENLHLLSNEFEERFQDIMDLKMDFDLFATPFSINTGDTPKEVQLELIDLNSDIQLADSYRNRTSLLHFYSQFPKSRFPCLCRWATSLISMSGSTYVCETLFSAMKLNSQH